MNLKLVTWDGDLTQFLVEADTYDEAIKKAIKMNFEYCDPGDDCDGLSRLDMQDWRTYEVEEVDFKLLSVIFKAAGCGVFDNGILVGSY